MSSKKAIDLYRSILREHKRVLPNSMRLLGDSYVKYEFDLHKKAKDKHLELFFKEWEYYLNTLRLSKDGKVGKNLNETDKIKLSNDQYEKLDEFKSNLNGLIK